MPNAGSYRVAFVLPLLALLTVLSGSLVTSNGSLSKPLTSAALSVTGHRHFGMAAGAILIASLAWLAITDKRLAALAWTLCAALLAEGLLGSDTWIPTGPAIRALHASLAHLLFAGVVAIALMSSPVWKRGPELVRDYGWPSMRSLAVMVPVLVILQVALGASFRQGLLGLMPHVLGAMVVALFVLLLGAFVLQQFPDHQMLRPAARTLMVMTFAQVFLGIAAFTVRALPTQETVPLLVATAAHVVTGALTLGAAAVLGILIRRNVQPKAQRQA
jgi:heme A synthase